MMTETSGNDIGTPPTMPTLPHCTAHFNSHSLTVVDSGYDPLSRLDERADEVDHYPQRLRHPPHRRIEDATQVCGIGHGGHGSASHTQHVLDVEKSGRQDRHRLTRRLEQPCGNKSIQICELLIV